MLRDSRIAENRSPSLVELTFAGHVLHLNSVKRGRGGMKGAKALDRARQSFDRAMVLLNDVVQVFALPKLDLVTIPRQLPHRILPIQTSQIATASVDGNLLRHTVRTDGLPEETLCGSGVTPFGQPKINRVAVFAPSRG